MPNALPDSFWTIIDTARSGMADPNESISSEKLEEHLKTLSDAELLQFEKDFYQGLINLNDWKLWGAGYVMAGGMGDDSFHYFRAWILGRGREAYETALTNPDDLGKYVNDEDDFDNEALEYVALEILESRGIEEDPREDFEVTADDAPRGEQWAEDELDEKYPVLSARFG